VTVGRVNSGDTSAGSQTSALAGDAFPLHDSCLAFAQQTSVSTSPGLYPIDVNSSRASRSGCSDHPEPGRRLLGEQLGAEAAELEAVRILLAAGDAGRHGASLGVEEAESTSSAALESRFWPKR
jgi:hypothetical protein